MYYVYYVYYVYNIYTFSVRLDKYIYIELGPKKPDEISSEIETFVTMYI